MELKISIRVKLLRFLQMLTQEDSMSVILLVKLIEMKKEMLSLVRQIPRVNSRIRLVKIRIKEVILLILRLVMSSTTSMVPKCSIRKNLMTEAKFPLHLMSRNTTSTLIKLEVTLIMIRMESQSSRRTLMANSKTREEAT